MTTIDPATPLPFLAGMVEDGVVHANYPELTARLLQACYEHGCKVEWWIGDAMSYPDFKPLGYEKLVINRVHIPRAADGKPSWPLFMDVLIDMGAEAQAWTVEGVEAYRWTTDYGFQLYSSPEKSKVPKLIFPPHDSGEHEYDHKNPGPYKSNPTPEAALRWLSENMVARCRERANQSSLVNS